MSRGARSGFALLIGAALAAVLWLGMTYPQADVAPAVARGGINVFTDKTITAENRLSSGGSLDVAGDAAIGGQLTVAGASNYVGNASWGGNGTITGDLVVGSSLSAVKQSNITVTNNMTITVTGSYTALTAAGAVGTSSIAGCETNGHLTVFENVGTNIITITDTGKLKLSANWAAGQFDSLATIGDGSNCIEFARANN